MHFPCPGQVLAASWQTLLLLGRVCPSSFRLPRRSQNLLWPGKMSPCSVFMWRGRERGGGRISPSPPCFLLPSKILGCSVAGQRCPYSPALCSCGCWGREISLPAWQGQMSLGLRSVLGWWFPSVLFHRILQRWSNATWDARGSADGHDTMYCFAIDAN